MEKFAYRDLIFQQNKHWWFRGKREIIIDYAEHQAAFKKDPQNKTLDVGCGMGFLLSELVHYGEVYGMDVEPEAVNYCRSVFDSKGGGKNFYRFASLPRSLRK